MKNLFSFLQYNNAVPVALGVIVLGASGAFAATDPQAIYSSAQRVVSVDNTYIANVDLSSYTPRVQITGVTEDNDNYYVAYTLSTIDVQDSVWRDVAKPLSLTVSKSVLGSDGDLGLYATGKLTDMVSHELDRLRQTQEIERKNVTPKTVSTTYGGLVGKFLDPTADTLPGYTPVVIPPARASTQPSDDYVGTANTSQVASEQSTVPPLPAGVAGVLQVMGNNPAHITIDASYADLGVYVADPAWQNFGVHVTLDGKDVEQVQIDTSTSSIHQIVYRIQNSAGQTAEANRTVIVQAANDTAPATTTAASSAAPPTNDNPPITPLLATGTDATSSAQ